MHADQSVTDDKVKSHTCCIFVRALPKSCIDKFHQEKILRPKSPLVDMCLADQLSCFAIFVTGYL